VLEAGQEAARQVRGPLRFKEPACRALEHVLPGRGRFERWRDQLGLVGEGDEPAEVAWREVVHEPRQGLLRVVQLLAAHRSRDIDGGDDADGRPVLLTFDARGLERDDEIEVHGLVDAELLLAPEAGGRLHARDHGEPTDIQPAGPAGDVTCVTPQG
jgi:hypothetical protein